MAYSGLNCKHTKDSEDRINCVTCEKYIHEMVMVEKFEKSAKLLRCLAKHTMVHPSNETPFTNKK
jgi:hypothetical protein